MVPAFFVWMFFLSAVRAQIVFTVLPVTVEPGFTPLFTLSCSVPEQEEGQIESISIFRQAATAIQARVSPRETIAQLRGPAPGQIIQTPGYNINVTGQIISFLEIEAAEAEIEQTPQVWLTPEEELLGAQQEALAAQQAELGTYLEIIWPEPQAEDLGVYRCEVTILGIATRLTLFGEVAVTTSNPVTDRLLAVVQKIQGEAEIFNRTLSDVETEIDLITAELQEVRRAQYESNTGKQVTNESEISGRQFQNTTSTEVSPTQESFTDWNDTEQSTAQTADAELRRLSVALENLEVKFERFNATLRRLNVIVTVLEERVEQTAVNKTFGYLGINDVVRSSFTYQNAYYLLYQTKQTSTARRAQAVCASKGLYLAEINSAEDFQNVTEIIDPSVQVGDLVLVGGERTLGQNEWIFQNSQQLVNFFAWGASEQGEASSDEYLALNKTEVGWSTVPLAGPNYYANLYFLCQQNVAY